MLFISCLKQKKPRTHRDLGDPIGDGPQAGRDLVPVECRDHGQRALRGDLEKVGMRGCGAIGSFLLRNGISLPFVPTTHVCGDQPEELREVVQEGLGLVQLQRFPVHGQRGGQRVDGQVQDLRGGCVCVCAYLLNDFLSQK